MTTNRCPTCGSQVNSLEVLTDPDRGLVCHDGKTVSLTRIEFRYFKAMLDAYPSSLLKERIFDQVYGDRIADDDFPNPKVVDVVICKMRKKLDRTGLIITTEWGRGYGLTLADPDAAERLRRESLSLNRQGRSQPWTAADDEALAALLDRKMGLQQIAATMRRPYMAVQRAMDRLGLDRKAA